MGTPDEGGRRHAGALTAVRHALAGARERRQATAAEPLRELLRPVVAELGHMRVSQRDSEQAIAAVTAVNRQMREVSALMEEVLAVVRMSYSYGYVDGVRRRSPGVRRRRVVRPGR